MHAGAAVHEDRGTHCLVRDTPLPVQDIPHLLVPDTPLQVDTHHQVRGTHQVQEGTHRQVQGSHLVVLVESHSLRLPVVAQRVPRPRRGSVGSHSLCCVVFGAGLRCVWGGEGEKGGERKRSLFFIEEEEIKYDDIRSLAPSPKKGGGGRIQDILGSPEIYFGRIRAHFGRTTSAPKWETIFLVYPKIILCTSYGFFREESEQSLFARHDMHGGLPMGKGNLIKFQKKGRVPTPPFSGVVVTPSRSTSL